MASIPFLFSLDLPETIRSYVADWEWEIKMKGNLGQSHVIRSVQVLLSDYILNVLFWDNLGSVTVTVYSVNGDEIYRRTIDSASGEQLLIGVSGWVSGRYTTEITNSSGNFIRGDFKL